LNFLGKKLRGLKLSKKNEPVQWKNEDEIGALIAIYNEMIQKLSDNAKVMAKVERDSAWKEMAKQVAHEIKNPLTPLKLNIQYLEAKIRMSPEDAQGLITQITPGLIEQIDNLSQIASEFSNFAQLPSARNEKIRLNEIVKTVHDFFRKREDLKFQLFVPINDILVFADRNHLIRILNNVVKNAIQAIPPEREGEIILRLYTKDNDAIVQITDNGSGIPEEMQDKVFSPNFTTKSSGTGLGLAISLNMLESFNGRIYFETEEDEGTDFFIEIPLMRLEDNYPESKKVILDD
jgi:two-component system nitrogen regulation sensor histidine kinase NtrY